MSRFRSNFLTMVAGAVTAALPAGTQAANTSTQGHARPNILHIHADDHRPDGLHALGTPLLQTPNLDTLVERGMTFTRCYTMGSMVGAVCAPSRAMLLTGRSWLRIPGGGAAAADAADPSTFLPRVMAAAGYQTWHMGKAGESNAFGTGLKHFEIHIPDEGSGTSPEKDRAHCSRRLADKTIEFLESRDADGEQRPFYAYLAPPVPHDPRSAEPQFHKLYDPAQIPLSPAFMPQHPFDNGEMTVRDEKLAPWPRTPENTRQQLADYYACITGLDHHVGRIFEQLKKSGQWDNTIIIFSADNGLSMGEHGLFGKQNLYEFGGMHVPLVVAGPGIAQGKSEAFVYLMDLFPTFAEFAGAKIPDGVEGKSIVPILTGKQTKVRDVLYTAYRGCQRAIRDDRWKLIRYPLVDRTQLFDLQADPLELNNLADKPEHAAKIVELTALLTKEMASYADTFPLTVADSKPAEWTPPVPGTKPKRPGKKRPAATAAPAAAAAEQPTEAPAAEPSRPNIVFVLFDDMGYGEPKCYREDTQLKTPNMDRLATEGMRFTDAHSAAAVCTPTRYGLLTGRYPSRIGQYGVLTTYNPPIIPKTRLTVASLLKQNGYETACIGKWHLGMVWDGKPGNEKNVPVGEQLKEGPNAAGFDYFYGFTHARNIETIIEQDRVAENVKAVENQPRMISKAVEWVGERKTGKPFFLYFPMCPPHEPVVPAPEFVGKSGATDVVNKDPNYGDWVYQGDHMLGQLLDALEKNGLAESTLVIVSADNGAASRPYPPLRGAKASIYEGGHRVPFLARWPGRIKPGSVSDQTICLNDFMATCADIVGAKLPDNAGEDSVSILPALLGTADEPLRAATIHQAPNRDLAIRKGPWKLIFSGSNRQLYHLGTDLGETDDIADANPEVVASLTALMQKVIDEGRSTAGAPQKNDVPMSIDGRSGVGGRRKKGGGKA